MPEPEIARRCPTCGASIREIAFFCPQCGRDLSQQTAKPSPDVAHQATTEPLHLNTAPLNDPPVQPRRDSQREQPKSGPAARGAVGTKMQRAATRARNVEGDVVQRVKKVREMSSVVFDEAAFDPSLRFVLVAAFLFIVFLFIVLLNRFIT